MAAVKDPVHNLAEALELLERHISILRTVKGNQPIGLIRLSEMTGIPKHRVRYSLKIMEQQGIIIPTSDGATVSDDYDTFMEDMTKSIEMFVDEVATLRDLLRNRSVVSEGLDELVHVSAVAARRDPEFQAIQRIDVVRSQIGPAADLRTLRPPIHLYPTESVRRNPFFDSSLSHQHGQLHQSIR